MVTQNIGNLGPEGASEQLRKASDNCSNAHAGPTCAIISRILRGSQ
jgi:hypothetical protein